MKELFVDSAFQLTGVRIRSANRIKYAPVNSEVSNRNRKRWALALKREGCTRYTAGDNTYISDAKHIMLLPKGSKYRWTCTESGECLMIEFDADQTYDGILSFEIADTTAFLNTFYQIRKSQYFPTPEASLESSYLLFGLLLQLVKSKSTSHTPKKKQLLQPALHYIAEKYHEGNISTDYLAELCGISTVYFRKCFREEFGVSPIRYLHELQIQKAKDLLSSDYSSIAQVAQCVGCRDITQFSKMFRSHTGLTPTQYADITRK